MFAPLREHKVIDLTSQTPFDNFHPCSLITFHASITITNKVAYFSLKRNGKRSRAGFLAPKYLASCILGVSWLNAKW